MDWVFCVGIPERNAPSKLIHQHYSQFCLWHIKLQGKTCTNKEIAKTYHICEGGRMVLTVAPGGSHWQMQPRQWRQSVAQAASAFLPVVEAVGTAHCPWTTYRCKTPKLMFPSSLRLWPNENCHNTSTLSCSPPPCLASLHTVLPAHTLSCL